MIHQRLQIHGRVQGVCFRDWSVGAARALGLCGWVRNRLDGSVEAVVSGDPAAVSAFVEQCRRGPPHARVERIDQEDAIEEDHASFVMRPTA